MSQKKQLEMWLWYSLLGFSSNAALQPVLRTGAQSPLGHVPSTDGAWGVNNSGLNQFS